MALETIIDRAEVDDLGFRVAAEEPSAHSAREAMRPSRVFAVWGAALVAIAMVGLLGRLFEPRPAACCPSAASVNAAPQSAPGRGWPSNGHSTFRYPEAGKTTMTLQLERVPGLDGSIARIEVSGRISGPVAKLAVQLVSGVLTHGQATRHFSTLAGRPPSPFGVFDIAFPAPNGTAISDLWIIARAYVDGRVVAAETFPVDPTWPQAGPDKYILDDVFIAAQRLRIPDVASRAFRVGGLGWQVDPYAR
ncbi:MAG: hypothetical protein L0221_18070 [Chloroflexi bacterium]|nr:hypothetical protein [Chloroflexota bacterium]